MARNKIIYFDQMMQRLFVCLYFIFFSGSTFFANDIATVSRLLEYPDDSSFGDVWINEIMADPRGLTDFPETEYVELYNASNADINLKDWMLIYNLTTNVPLPDILLPVGGYAVVHRSAKTIHVDAGGIAIPIASFPSTLANAGRKLELKNAGNILIDSVTYKTAASGCSWERDAVGNLYLSYDPRGGTPGSINSVKLPDHSQYGDVRINEVMVDPRGLTAFHETEYVELFNTSNTDINLKDWTFIYDERIVMTLPDVLLTVGSYAVLHRTAKPIDVDSGGTAIPLSTFPSTLANAGRKLELKNAWDVLIDSVTYKAATSGYSWERDAVGNLYLSYDPRGGTPGSINSVKPPDYSQYGDVRINEVMVDPRGLTAFHETEYVELFNTSNTDINLKDWTFIYDERVVMTLPDVLLPMGGYVVLHRNTKPVYVDSGGIAIPLSTFPSTLANAGRKLELKNSWDVLIDSVTYNAASSGCSWERDPAGNLYLSYDPRGGTPGSVNSVKLPDYSQFGDVWINEVMVDPRGLTAFPETEYVELYNASNVDINLKDWMLIYDERVNVVLPDTILPFGRYAVLYRADKEIYIGTGGIPIPLASFPSTLANSGRTLELTNSWAVLIDSVTYKAAETGCSWERDAAGNLYLSYDPRGGTPGSVNSVKPPDYSRYGDVRINEVMTDPRGLTTFPETEYIELYNASHTDINLKRWTFSYDERVSITLPDTLLPVGGYAVLYRTGKEIHVDNGGIAIPLATFPSTLANAGRKLELTNSWNVLIDSVTYKTAETGCSWERDAAGNLYLSYDPRGGTPGSVNSVKPPDYSRYGDVRINEVMADPRGLTAFPETEYVELYNAADTDINLKRWTFIYDERVSIALPDTILPVGGYAVLFRTGKEIHVDNGGISIPMAAFPSTLANAGRKLELTNSWDVLIDSVTYKAAETGCSRERDAASGNLYLSYDLRGGTPGSVNSVRPPDYSRYGDVLINEVMPNPRGLTAFPEMEYVELYNVSNAVMNLKGWTFIYDERVHVVLPETMLPVAGYAVLYRTGKDIHIDNGGIAIPLATFPSTLANAGRKLMLINSWDVLIDSVTYRTAQYARSWERDTENNLYLSNDLRGGTPGSVNSSPEQPKGPDYSVYGDVLINEIMADPRGLTAFPETEYVELHNTSGVDINLNGWSFIYDERVMVALPNVVLPVDGFVVLHRANKEIHVDDSGIAIPLATFPSTLANAGRMLELTNSLGILIDSVAYQTATSARSWERDTGGNLYLSNNPRGGTPGIVNSPKELPIEPDDSQYGDIRINEIMADPRGLTAFPETEYVELYNASEVDINLRGWSFIYDERVHVALPDVTLLTDGYAVLYRAGREIHVDEGGMGVPVTTFPSTLANTGRYVEIKNPKGTLIDSITYHAAVGGWAWERDPDGNLYLSNNPRGGTPGSANSSQYNPKDPIEPTLFVDAKEWIFNELLPEQKEGGSEFIELYNRSSRPLFLSGLSIATRGADGTLSTRYSLSAIKESFLPGEYIVLTTNRDGVLDFYYTPAPHRVYELRLPVLNNTGSTLVLLRTNDESAIDEVSYSSQWHDRFIRNYKGVSLERIHPDTDTQNPDNWISATSEAGYGTPGYTNSQNRTHDVQEAIQVGIPEYRHGFGDYAIHYQMDKNGYRCRMEVYMLEGQRVAEITNNQLMGFEGEIRWNGTGSDGSRLRSGIYIFYTEVFHPDGERKSFKNVFLVKP